MPIMPRPSSKRSVRPNMRFVGINSEEQQAVLMMHRVRTLVVANRTALVNQVRGLLGELSTHATRVFRNGRQFAAWLGLTPRQHSSGGVTRLGRITKGGDRFGVAVPIGVRRLRGNCRRSWRMPRTLAGPAPTDFGGTAATAAPLGQRLMQINVIGQALGVLFVDALRQIVSDAEGPLKGCLAGLRNRRSNLGRV